jgi:hypothetical protein
MESYYIERVLPSRTPPAVPATASASSSGGPRGF